MGFVVRNLLLFNRAILGKWLGYFVHEREALWRIVVDTKLDSSWGEWCSNEVHGFYGVGLWKSIRRGWESFMVIPGLRWVIVLRFWHDLGCGDHGLNKSFSVFYSIAREKML
jgi:hypothetical protein